MLSALPYLFRVAGSSLLFVCLFVLCFHKTSIFFSISMKNMVRILMRIVLNVNAAFKNTLPAIVVLRIALLFLHLLVAFIPGNFLEDIEIEIYSPMSSTYALNVTIYCCLSCSCFSIP